MRILPCGRERAEDVHRLTQAAFAPYRHLDPPSGAVSESLERVMADLSAGGGAIAEVDGAAVGCLRWAITPDAFQVRRVAVDPAVQRSGIGRALMAWAEEEASRRGCEHVVLGVRIALPDNLAVYERLGYAAVAEHRHEGYDRTTWLTLRKRVADPT